MTTDLYAGVELGGTKCVAILAGGPDDIVARETVPTTSPTETIGALGEILRGWRSRNPRSLGIASFGPLDLAAGRMTSTPKPGWEGAEILKPLRDAAGVPATIDTDVNGAALAEMRWGSGRGMDDFAYITVGTGVGAGLVVNGQATRGFAHSELGHVRVARLAGDHFPGSCPYHGDCVEGLASGPSLEARAEGRDLAHISGDDPMWASAAYALAQLCHFLVCAAAPRAIAIGGGVAAKQRHLLSRVEAMLTDSLAGYLELPGGGPYIRAPELGNNAGPMGAIALAMSVPR